MDVPTSILLIVLYFTCIYPGCFCQGDNDPLYLLKKYYSEHENEHNKYIKIPTVDTFRDKYDFVIIGGGSGGSVMASRLSEISQWSVLLLEAGEQENFITDVPLFSRISIGTNQDWNYKIEKQSNCAQAYGGYGEYARGKALGGTSVINGMVYMRGNRHNYDDWEKLGNRGWSYKNILKYFKKSEDINIEALKNSTYHNRGGYLTVEHSNYQTNLTYLYLEAGRELGYDIVDYNGETQTGFYKEEATLRNGRRCSASKAFLRPASGRKNLSISTSTLVTRIVINRWTKRATGVEFKKNGALHTVYARKEVILSAGTINSPQLLMLSGIGPKEHLRSKGIKVIKNLKVGRNMMDHVGVPQLKFNIDGDFTIKQDVIESEQVVKDYFERGVGPLTVPEGNKVYGLMKSKYARKDIDLPDFELGFAVSRFDVSLLQASAQAYDFNRRTSLAKDISRGTYRASEDIFSIFVMIYYPRSIGKVELNSKDPEEQPKIFTNCLAEREDVDILKEGLKAEARGNISFLGGPAENRARIFFANK